MRFSRPRDGAIILYEDQDEMRRELACKLRFEFICSTTGTTYLTARTKIFFVFSVVNVIDLLNLASIQISASSYCTYDFSIRVRYILVVELERLSALEQEFSARQPSLSVQWQSRERMYGLHLFVLPVCSLFPSSSSIFPPPYPSPPPSVFSSLLSPTTAVAVVLYSYFILV